MSAEQIVWAFLGVVGTAAVLFFLNKMTKNFVTEEQCQTRRNQCEVCKDVSVIKSVLFEVANHLQVPGEKYKDLTK